VVKLHHVAQRHSVRINVHQNVRCLTHLRPNRFDKSISVKTFAMTTAKTNHYREILLELRDRARGEVNHVAQALQEEVRVKANASSAPVHMADIAAEAVDAEVEVLQTERGILEEINQALARIETGEFGKCATCGEPISEERLKAIPYVSNCVTCARTSDKRGY